MVRFPIFAAVLAGKLTAIEALLHSDPATMPEEETAALVRTAKLEQGEAPVSTASFVMDQAIKHDLASGVGFLFPKKVQAGCAGRFCISASLDFIEKCTGT